MSTDFSGTEHAQRWRHMEAEPRLMVLSMSDGEQSVQMLFIVDGYRRLAERAETLTATTGP